MLNLLTIFGADSSCAKVNAIDYCTNLPRGAATSENLQNILQMLFGVFAVVAVLIIVIQGLNIVTADGDSAKVAKARSGIIYALIGLAIMLIAEGIVRFVVGKF
jgi:type IV secretory pathway VirB2 component (pilin)